MDINGRDFKEILSHLKLSFIMQLDAAVISACFTLEVQPRCLKCRAGAIMAPWHWLAASISDVSSEAAKRC